MQEEEIPPSPNKYETKSGALEGDLDNLRTFIIWLAILIAAIGTVLIIQTKTKILFATLGLLYLKIFIWAFIVSLILKFAAEILRLLKHQANLPYSGNISEPETRTSYHCPNCNDAVSGSPCPSCGQKMSKPS